MNAFTKEELQRIYNLVNKSMRIDPMDKVNLGKTILLSGKIKHLIESYCEHEAEPSHEICCIKCQRTLL